MHTTTISRDIYEHLVEQAVARLIAVRGCTCIPELEWHDHDDMPFVSISHDDDCPAGPAMNQEAQ